MGTKSLNPQKVQGGQIVHVTTSGGEKPFTGVVEQIERGSPCPFHEGVKRFKVRPEQGKSMVVCGSAFCSRPPGVESPWVCCTDGKQVEIVISVQVEE